MLQYAVCWWYSLPLLIHDNLTIIGAFTVLSLLRGIAWRASERESFVTEHRAAIDLAFSLEQDTWNGERYLQPTVADFRAPDN